MKVTLKLLLYGGLAIFASVLFISVILPWLTISEKPSEIFRPRTALETKGRDLYIANGCTYCHTQFVRNIDWDLGATRVARSGDYVAEQPHLLGSERTGPDLSQEGGEHPDDWHLAHYTNARFVRPESIMPAFAYLGRENIMALIAYKQALGFKDADFRVERQRKWKQKAIEAYKAGPDKNVDWIHSMAPAPWRALPDPTRQRRRASNEGAGYTRASASAAMGRSETVWALRSPIFTRPPSTSPSSRGEGFQEEFSITRS